MRLGLVGAGSDARLRAECYEQLADVTVGGVAGDADPDWAAANYDDAAALLSSERLDAVDVCDPRGSQREIVDACLDAGVGVVCRTPLAHDRSDARAIRDAAERGGAPVLVDGLHRLAREDRDAKARVEAGDVGTPTTVRTTRRLPGVDPGDRSGAAARDAVLRRALSPDVARARWLFGDVERVFTRTGGRSSNGGDRAAGAGSPDGDHYHAVAVARFASGAVGHLDVRVGDRHDRVSVGFEYSGTEGRLSYDSEAFAALEARATEPFEPGVAAETRRPRPSRELYERHAARVVACLRGDEDPVKRLDEAVETFRTVEAAVESARRGESVAVAEVTA